MSPTGYAVVVALVVLVAAVTVAARAVGREAGALRSSVGALAELRLALIPLRAQLEANGEAADRVDPRPVGGDDGRAVRPGSPHGSG